MLRGSAQHIWLRRIGLSYIPRVFDMWHPEDILLANLDLGSSYW